MKLTIATLPTTRQDLSADGLLARLRERFQRIPDSRTAPDISLCDALLSGLALFALKDPSLLAFDQRRHERNFLALFGIHNVPSDTRLREILDKVDPGELRAAFNDIFRSLQRGKALEPFAFHQGAFLLALDGTGYFSSNTIHCDSCLEKVNKKTGVVTYQHQLLGAAIVHPDLSEVIPLAPEPIIKQDGTTKNDCERNAGHRLLEKIRREHPRLKLIVIEDGLSSNGPHIEELLRHRMSFLLGAKPGDHAYLFNTLKNQGYHFEHNFGHGRENLSVVFAMLMMLAFLVDQTQELCCPLFQAVLAKQKSRRSLWHQLRSHFEHFVFTSLRHLYEVMLLDLAKDVPAPQVDTG